MKNKLMISALLFCSSLALAADATTTAPLEQPRVTKKKPTKIAPPTTSSPRQVDEAVPGIRMGTHGGQDPAFGKSVRGSGKAPSHK